MKDLRHGINLYRSCLSKKRYNNLAKAKKYAKKYTEMFGKQQYVYYCPYCFGYHITSHPRKEKNNG